MRSVSSDQAFPFEPGGTPFEDRCPSHLQDPRQGGPDRVPRRGFPLKRLSFLRGSWGGVAKVGCFDIDEARWDVGRGASRVRRLVQGVRHGRTCAESQAARWVAKERRCGGEGEGATRLTQEVPQPAGKRVMGVPAETGKKRRPLARDDEELSTTQKLARRECDWKGRNRRNGAHVREKLRNFGLRQEYDTHDPSGHEMLELPFLKKRSRIVEIVAANDLVFALAHSGVCVVFHRTTNKRVCYLNVHKDEVIRSLFYNKSCNAVITVSVYASENYSSLKCRSVPVEFIRRGQPDAGFPLFESESLKWPGFVEFDDVNGKVLTFSALDSIYKVFDLKNYNLLFEIRDKRVQEIKISPGIMLLIFERMANHVPLKILSIEDGTELKAFNHLLHRNKKIDFIEQFNEKLLVKQENENLQILDVLSGKVTEVNRTEFMTPSAFIFLYENQLFLTFRESTVGVWNFKGELVTSFEDHLLWHPDCNTNNIYINTGQDMIISYCRSGDGEHDRLRRPYSRGCKAPGSINVSNILTGRCLAKIQAPEGGSEADVRAQQALEEVTALFYDEERNEVLTGNKTGVVHVWTN